MKRLMFGLLAAAALSLGVVATPAWASASGQPDVPNTVVRPCLDEHAAKLHLTYTLGDNGRTLHLALSGDEPLCAKLYVTGALYRFKFTNQLWPQLLEHTTGGWIQQPGPDHGLTLTLPEGCGQRDWYAAYGKAPEPNKELTAAGVPPEPTWLNQFATGPTPYVVDDAKHCAPPTTTTHSTTTTVPTTTTHVTTTVPPTTTTTAGAPIIVTTTPTVNQAVQPLANTGVSLGWPIGIAAALLLGGAGAAFFARRGRSGTHTE